MDRSAIAPSHPPSPGPRDLIQLRSTSTKSTSVIRESTASWPGRRSAASATMATPHIGYVSRGLYTRFFDVTDLIWKRARMAGFSLFAQSSTAIVSAWRSILPLIVSGSGKPLVEWVYPFGEAAEALRHLIEDRPFGKVVLAG